ncbi:MAG: hypothetical protein AAF598_22065, partial [Bacteroidota bacterium]
MYLVDRERLRTNYPHKHEHVFQITELGSYLQSLFFLKDIPTARLDRLFREHIDICSYRLDPWIQGQAVQRLDEDRSEVIHRLGGYLGAFGWIENLAPGDVRTLATDLPGEFNNMGRVHRDGDNLGFIHGPSLDHAVAAAIMRSGYLANNQDDDAKNVMAINLSSARVRTALNMMDGVRNGQEPGALLVYMFERGLHEGYPGLELNAFIFPLRRAFPIEAEVDETLSNPDAHGIAEFNVVNGTAILDKVMSVVEDKFDNLSDTLFKVLMTHPDLYPFGLKDKQGNSLLPNRTSQKEEYWAILREIDRMADAFDALSDLTLAESVFQVAKGNYERAGTVADAIAKGTVPPEPQIVNTPRSGKVVTHKVVWNMSAFDSRTINTPTQISNALPAGWKNISLSPVAKANLSVNYMLGEILGNPADIRFLVGEDAQQLVTQSIADLDIQALDLIRLMDGETGGSDLERLIAYRYIVAQNLPNDTEITISFKERDPAWTPNVRTLFDLAPLVKSLQEVVSESKGIYADDLLIPGEAVDNPGGLVPDEMESRFLAVRSRLEVIHQSLVGLIYDANNKLKTSLNNTD